MFASYRDVLSRPGALGFSAAAFVGRMPISMVTLAIVLLVEARSDSYGLAGSVSAAYMVATAVSSPALARLIDQWGQRRVLVPCFIGFSAGLGAMVLSVELDWPLPLPHLLAAVAGLSFPPIGACVRSRWTYLLGQGPSLHTAFSVEAVLDETIFILGPVLVTVLATRIDPMAGVASVAAFAIIGGFWFTSQRRTEPPASTTKGTATRREPFDWGWLLPMVAVALCLGSLFGAIEVATVAFAEEQGKPRLTGVLLAVYAAGSLIAGLITGMLSGDIASTRRRYRLGAVGMAAAMMPLPFVDNLVVLSVVLFLGGFAVSPTLVSFVSLIEANVPPARLTEGITWVLTGVGLGIAPGAALAGVLIDSKGASAAYWVSAVSGVLAAVLAAMTGGRVAATSPALEGVEER